MAVGDKIPVGMVPELPKYSAEKDLSNLDTPQVAIYNLGAGVRPNLLDNWDFTNPINQKGVTTGNTDWSIMFDRWKQFGGQWTLTSQGLQMKLKEGSSYWSFLQQSIIDTNSLIGRTVTCSVLVDGQLYSGTVTLKRDGAVEFCTISPERMEIAIDSVSSSLRVQYYGATTTRTIQAIKLELGYKQTLARKTESGYELLENISPSMELLKCQRYYIQYKAYNVRFPAFINNNVGFATIQIPSQMVKKPSFILLGDDYGVLYGATQAPNGASITEMTYTSIIIQLNFPSNAGVLSANWGQCYFALDTGM